MRMSIRELITNYILLNTYYSIVCTLSDDEVGEWALALAECDIDEVRY